MEHRISRPRQRPELAASHHAVRIAIAVNQHGGAEPFAVEPPANRYPIELGVLIVHAHVSADPALLDPCTPAKIDLLGLQRSEERRVGKECVSKCRSRWSPYH